MVDRPHPMLHGHLDHMHESKPMKKGPHESKAVAKEHEAYYLSHHKGGEHKAHESKHMAHEHEAKGMEHDHHHHHKMASHHLKELHKMAHKGKK